MAPSGQTIGQLDGLNVTPLSDGGWSIHTLLITGHGKAASFSKVVASLDEVHSALASFQAFPEAFFREFFNYTYDPVNNKPASPPKGVAVSLGDLGL